MTSLTLCSLPADVNPIKVTGNLCSRSLGAIEFSSFGEALGEGRPFPELSHSTCGRLTCHSIYNESSVDYTNATNP